MATAKLLASKAVRVLFAVVLVLGLAPTLSLARAGDAWADGTVWIDNTGQEWYDGYGTNYFRANGYPAWCSQPNMPTPAGSYSYESIPGDRSVETTALAVGLMFCTMRLTYEPEMGDYRDYGTFFDGLRDGWTFDSGLIGKFDEALNAGNANDSWYCRFHVFLSYAMNETFPGYCDPFKGCVNPDEWRAGCEIFWNHCMAVATGEGFEGINKSATDYLRAVAQTSTIGLTDGGQQQDIIWLEVLGEGSGQLSVEKLSANPGITDGNDCYSLAGARYDIYASRDDANARENAIDSMTTDSEGKAVSGDLAPGTYYVRESADEHGQNYAVDETIYEEEVAGGEVHAIGEGEETTVSDVPQNDPAMMWAFKYDAETGQASTEYGNNPQGDGSLHGAQFTVQYFDTLDLADVAWDGDWEREWVVETDEDGYAELVEDYKVSGSDFYYNSAGKVTIPIGTVLIKETKAPEGYNLPDPATVYTRQVTGEGIVEDVLDYAIPAQPDEVQRGGASIQKTDAETGGAALGGATLEGAVFEITNESDGTVLVNGKQVGPGEVATTITTGADGIASTRTDELPYGSYSAREIVAPEGYLGTDKVVEFSIDAEGQMAELYLEQGFQNQVKRGDLEFVKADGATGERMAGIPFAITSKTTGESHVIVTDANGYASTSADWNAHSHDTNGNDGADDADLDDEAGVWFGGEAGAAVDDSKGALPYDSYLVEELPCEANADRQLVSTSVTISRDSVTVDLGTIDDPQASIATSAADAADGDHVVAAGAEAKVVDYVHYAGLVPGRTYTVEGSMQLTDGGQALELGGRAVTGSATFTPSSPAGTVEVAYDLGKTVEYLPGGEAIDVTATVFEVLYDQDGREIARHDDLGDTAQQVRIVPPEASTQASDAADDDRIVSADTAAVIDDAVSYKHLQAGSEYRIVTAAALYEDAAGIAPDDLGAALGTSEATFAAEPGSGEVATSVTVDTTGYEDGQRIVLFEWIYDAAGNLVAEHADPEDAAQTVEILNPSIGTTAADGADGDQVIVDDGSRQVILKDTVSYEGLVAGRAYEAVGTLVDKATGEPILDAEGEPVTATAEFSPALSAGTVEVEFSFDPSSIPDGGEIVAFESVTLDGVEVAAHADIDDEGQTVKIVRPQIGTAASDGADGDKTVVADPATTVEDSVSVENVVEGRGYRMAGILMDASTGLPFLTGEAADGDAEELASWWDEMKAALGMSGEDASLPAAADLDKAAELLGTGIGQRTVTADVPFSLADSWGSVEAAFGPFDSSLVEDSTRLVVFEALLNEEGSTVVAVHADIDDEGQSVRIVRPRIGTDAADGLDGDKNAVAGPETTVVDTVRYSQLVVGRAYEISGTLMVKSTGEPLLDADGNPVTASVELVPEHPQGSVELEFTFDSSLLVGDAVVAFESLYADGIEVAVHADIDDEGQTVQVTAPEIDTEAADGLDGDKTVVADPDAEVVDTLSYSNVIPGSYVTHGFLMDASTGLPLLVGEGAEEVSDLELESFWASALDLLGIEQSGEPYDPKIADEETEEAPVPEGSALSGVFDAMAALEEAEAEADADGAQVSEPAGQTGQIQPFRSDWEGLELLMEENPDIAEHLATCAVGFDADDPEGEVEASFGIDTAEIAGKRAVVFQVLATAADGDEAPLTVAYHADIEDAGQSVDIVPSEIGTEAVDKTDGDHTILSSSSATVVDRVSYENLIPGQSYTVKGQLIDKSTGKVLIAGDEPVTAEATFVPNQPTGTVEVEFAFDASAIEPGTQLVAFETLYKDGLEVAVHADIEDAAQTVTVEEPPLGGFFDKTGASTAVLAGCLLAVAAAGAGAAAYGIRRNRKAEADGGDAAA